MIDWLAGLASELPSFSDFTERSRAESPSTFPTSTAIPSNFPTFIDNFRPLYHRFPALRRALRYRLVGRNNGRTMGA